MFTGCVASSNDYAINDRLFTGWAVWLSESLSSLRCGLMESDLRLDNKSRMSREVHVRFREGLGVRFPRATRLLVFTKTEVAAKRVFASVERYLTRKLKLVVNRQKSRVCRTAGVEFLGFELHGYGGQIRVSEKNLKKFK